MLKQTGEMLGVGGLPWGFGRRGVMWNGGWDGTGCLFCLEVLFRWS